MKRIEREGYGSAFNELYIEEDRIYKIPRSEYGKRKIDFEKRFYEYVYGNTVEFPIPENYKEEGDGYSMRYYKGWVPLFQVLQKDPRVLSSILPNVHSSLKSLHTSRILSVSKETVKQDLLYEMVDKLLERKKEVENILEAYTFLKTVNGLQLESFETLLQFFIESIDSFLLSRPAFSYKPIHGDCQFNNILISPDSKKILFIDPRASFGKSALYGLEEYDSAKILFALSGYDTFDASKIESLNIQGTDLILPTLELNDTFVSNSFPSILTASIWLGNAHCFKSSPLKAVTSYYYGLYYATLVFREVKSGIK